jgi:hypothetical protein
MPASKAKRKAPSKTASVARKKTPAKQKAQAVRATASKGKAKPSSKPKAKDRGKPGTRVQTKVTAKAKASPALSVSKRAKAKQKPAAPQVSSSKKATPARDAVQALTQKRAIAAALSPVSDGKAVVDAYMRDVDHPFKAEMQAVREIILGVSPKISERIKWNAPSFYYKEDLGAFNPRATEYAHLILVFPDGQGMQDTSGLLEGNHKDRREAKFYSLDDVKSKKRALEKIIKGWVELRD